MIIQTRYITPDELTLYSGIDFGAKLKGTANPSDKVAAFINRVEVRMEAYLNAHFFKLVTKEWPNMSDFQKEHYKYALLEQCIYVFRNGDISTDSGYEPEEGIKADRDTLLNITMSPNAIEHLQLTGLWTRHISGGSYFGNWFF